MYRTERTMSGQPGRISGGIRLPSFAGAVRDGWTRGEAESNWLGDLRTRFREDGVCCAIVASSGGYVCTSTPLSPGVAVTVRTGLRR